MDRVFHDAVVIDVRADSDALVLHLTSVRVHDGDVVVRRETGRLMLKRVAPASSEVSALDATMRDFDDAQILKLNVWPESCRLLLEWEHYSSGRTRVFEHLIPTGEVVWRPDIGEDVALPLERPDGEGVGRRDRAAGSP